MRSPKQPKRGEQVQGQAGRAAGTFQPINDLDLTGDMLIAERNVALSLSKVFSDQPQVHAWDHTANGCRSLGIW
ncbi:hypothetical protein ACVWY3_000574 [Bradyrhizobium sp. USDA 4486]